MCPSLQFHSVHSAHLIFRVGYTLVLSSKQVARSTDDRSLEALNPCWEGKRVLSEVLRKDPAQSNLLGV